MASEFDSLSVLEQDILTAGVAGFTFDRVVECTGFSRERVVVATEGLANKLGVRSADPEATLTAVIGAARNKRWIK
jgi:hypothetical protein